MPSVFLPPASSIEPFPRRWQDACRDLVTAYCKLDQNQRRGRPMGMTRLRNEIMANFDSFDATGRVADTSLGREDLEHWLKKFTYLSPTKFQYVDRWVRLLRRSRAYGDAMGRVIQYKERLYRAVFKENYASRPGDEKSHYGMPWPLRENQVYLSEVLPVPNASGAARYSRYASLADFRQIALLVRDVEQDSCSVTIVYLDTPLSSLRPDPPKDQWIVCFGYITLVSYDEYLSYIYCVLHAFRNAFPGQPNGGTSVSTLTLYPNDDEITTDWYNQVCSQDLTGGAFFAPNIMNSDGTGIAENNGSCRFTLAGDEYRHIAGYVATLTNGYLVW